MLIYRGPGMIPAMKSELAALLKADGFTCVAEAVGADHRERVDGAGKIDAGGLRKNNQSAPKGRGWFSSLAKFW